MKIAVYCGSANGRGDAWCAAADKLGRWIAGQGHTLVYGGGDAGLMGVVAKAVHEGGCEVIGVLPGNVAFISERPQPYCTQVIRAADMAERKRCMLNMADAFIALPGGIGTLDEITEAITLNRINVFHKPSVLFNAEGYYEPFRQMMQAMVSAGFIEAGYGRSVLFSDDTDAIADFLANWA